MGQDGLKMAPRWDKKRPRWAKIAPRWAKMGPRWAKMGLRWVKMGASWGHEPRWGQDVANLAAKDGHGQATGDHRRPPERYSLRVVHIFKMGSRWAKMGSRWAKMG